MLPALLICASAAPWQILFDGKSLSGWTPKIKGHELGVNFGNTFRVQNGAIVVSYDAYGGKFDNQFGHLFYKTPFSKYVLQMEYRFVGNQLPDGPGWANRNSGVMIHGQDPKTMTRDQDFPVSIEVQFLGGDGKSERTTANLCTPGTNVVMKGQLVTQHCLNSTSKTYGDNQWVPIEIEAHGTEKIIHRVEGEIVFEYHAPQLDPKDSFAQALIKGDKLLIEGGTISLQSESHPVEFRNIRLRKI